jgi:ferrous iron transport protein B
MRAGARVVLAGNPNAGKTTLFNALTGSSARTGNYPGVTVERRVGKVALEGGAIELIDLPGTYSLTARSPEEQVAVDAILPPAGRPPDAALVVCDASALERHLYLALQILETGLPVVIALNMMDEARASGIEIDPRGLASAIGAEVVPIVARSGEGTTELRAALGRMLASGVGGGAMLALTPDLERDVEELEAAIDDARPARRADTVEGRGDRQRRRARALWALLSIGGDELVGVAPGVREAAESIRGRATRAGRSIDREIIGARYARIDELTRAHLRSPEQPRRSATDRIDAVLTHPVFGALSFLVVMLALFEALFTWSEPMVSGIEWLVAAAQIGVSAVVPDGPFQELLVDGVIAGVGNVIVFVPQIAMLSLFIAVLEDSGYLARVAFVIDRVMHGVGLHGRAFVPLLSGFACAVPAVLATRTIENRKDRLVTMLALPLMSCSARLPVYTLVIAVAFPGTERIGLGLTVGALALLGMYVISMVATLGAAAVLRRTILRGPRPPLVLELPPYRWPVARNLGLSTWQRTRAFVTDAGTVILAITVVLWALLSYPRDSASDARFAVERAHAEAMVDEGARDAELARVDAERAASRMEHSAGGRIGRWIEPAIAPLGFDWKIGVGLIGSFAAREVLVSTLGIVYGVGADAAEREDEAAGGEPGDVDGGARRTSLREVLRSARRPDGTPVFTPLVGLSLMVFFVLAAQCMSTLAIVRRESGSWRWPILMLVYMNALAYLASLGIYQIGRLLGFG